MLRKFLISLIIFPNTMTFMDNGNGTKSLKRTKTDQIIHMANNFRRNPLPTKLTQLNTERDRTNPRIC